MSTIFLQNQRWVFCTFQKALLKSRNKHDILSKKKNARLYLAFSCSTEMATTKVELKHQTFKLHFKVQEGAKENSLVIIPFLSLGFQFIELKRDG